MDDSIYMCDNHASDSDIRCDGCPRCGAIQCDGIGLESIMKENGRVLAKKL